MKIISTFILALIWAGSATLYKIFGLAVIWAGVLGLVTALICGPFIDDALSKLTGKKK